MTHPFEIELHTELPATPEQVWEAIATGPGIDSWFMGRNEVEPLEGGRVTMETGDHREQAEVTAYDASTRFVTRTAPAADGRFVAFDYPVEGSDGGSTVLHVMHSGMLGDDWHDEYDALRRGWPFHLNTLREYLAHFPGRTALPIFAAAPMGGRSAADIRALLAGAPSLQAPITTGARARGGPGDLPPLDGEVFWADDERFAVHAADAIYTFHHGPERDAHVPPPVRPNQRLGRGRLAAVANQAPRLTQGNLLRKKDTTMRTLISTAFISADGVVEDPGGETSYRNSGWTFKGVEFVPEAYALKGSEQQESTAILMGRTSYEIFSPVWPGMAEFVHYKDLPKYVVSTTLTEDKLVDDWGPTTILRSLNDVAALKKTEGGPIIIHGSVALNHALSDAGLIDRYNLLVFPLLLGAGKRLFSTADKDAQKLKLVESEVYSNGIQKNIFDVVR